MFASFVVALFMSLSRGICTEAAALIAKYYINQGSRKPKLHPDEILVDPMNRDGLFATVDDVYEVADKVLGAGFDVSNTRGVCVQLPVDQLERAKIINYNVQKVRVSTHFPEVRSEHAAYSGLGGNTLNLFLRSVLQGRQAPAGKVPAAVDSKGCLSIETLRGADPGFADACQHGVPWIVLSHRLRVEEPGGVRTIQAAENVFGSIQRLTSEAQIIMRFSQLVADPAFATEAGFQTLKVRTCNRLQTHVLLRPRMSRGNQFFLVFLFLSFRKHPPGTICAQRTPTSSSRRACLLRFAVSRPPVLVTVARGKGTKSRGHRLAAAFFPHSLPRGSEASHSCWFSASTGAENFAKSEASEAMGLLRKAIFTLSCRTLQKMCCFRWRSKHCF